MAWREAYYVCESCGAYADCSASHHSVGVCPRCSAPAVWHHDFDQLTAWCSCRDWEAGRLATRQEALFRLEVDGALCPACGGEMRLGQEPGARALEGVFCRKPFKVSWIGYAVWLALALLVGYVIYYGST
jgi:hypothetical protein